MMNYRVWTTGVLLSCVALSMAQSWNSAYDAGLKAGKALKWNDARQDFKQATAYRMDDVPGPTTLPGPPTSRRVWRDGAPYSPNFLAAYCLYREGLAATNTTDQTTMMNNAAKELEGLLSKRQVSREAYFVLSTIYGKLDEATNLATLQSKYATAASSTPFVVDTEIMRPEEISQIQSFSASQTPPKPGTTTLPNSTVGSITPSQLNQSTGQSTNPIGGIGTILQLPNKFALVIGVVDANLPGNLDYADSDAERIKQALIERAGYLSGNVDTLVNPTASEILARAKGLAARMPEAGTLCIYYSGVGANIAGADYIAGADASSMDSTGGWVKKNELFGQFVSHSAHIFSFFQVNREMAEPDSPVFGGERTPEGSLSQMQATVAGGHVFSTYRNGKKTGLFTNAFIQTLSDLQSNRIPILEFGWQLFIHIRRGDTGQFDGSSQQIPSLPALNNLATDAQF